MKKEVLGFVIFIILFSIIMIYGLNRFEKIENNEMTLVNQNQMDR